MAAAEGATRPAPAARLRGGAARPDATIVVPVNAQGDLGNVRTLLDDLGRYDGPLAFEVVLVVNNFTAGEVPTEVAALERDGARVLALPSVREPRRARGPRPRSGPRRR